MANTLPRLKCGQSMSGMQQQERHLALTWLTIARYEILPGLLMADTLPRPARIRPFMSGLPLRKPCSPVHLHSPGFHASIIKQLNLICGIGEITIQSELYGILHTMLWQR